MVRLLFYEKGTDSVAQPVSVAPAQHYTVALRVRNTKKKFGGFDSRSLPLTPEDSLDGAIREGEPPVVPRPPTRGGHRTCTIEQLVFVFAGAATIWYGNALALGMTGDGAPTARTPFPFPLILFRFADAPIGLLALVPALTFLVWQPSLFYLEVSRPQMPPPIRTWVLLVTAAVLSLLWFVAGWRYGLEYEGSQFTYTCAAISAALALTAAILAVIAARTKNYYVNVLAHATLFYWSSSYAFPYLGELP